MALRFNPPPSWPVPPEGWVPPAGWAPDPAWGPVPAGWQLWVEDAPAGGAPIGQGAAVPVGQVVPEAPRSWFARHKILTGLGVVAVLVVVFGIAGGGRGDDASVEPPTAAAEPSADEAAGTGDAAPGDASNDGETAVEEPAASGSPAPPGLGVPVRDGRFEFVVNTVECGATTLGGDFLTTTAQGNFCLIDLSVTNIGDAPQAFWGDGQKLFDGAGVEYSDDAEAGFFIQDNALYEEVNPGNTLHGTLVYDVPVGTVPVSIELHDSVFSGGVTVALT